MILTGTTPTEPLAWPYRKFIIHTQYTGSLLSLASSTMPQTSALVSHPRTCTCCRQRASCTAMPASFTRLLPAHPADRMLAACVHRGSAHSSHEALGHAPQHDRLLQQNSSHNGHHRHHHSSKCAAAHTPHESAVITACCLSCTPAAAC